MTERIQFRSESGLDTGGELGIPAGEGRAPALILLPEWWGVNDHIRSLVDRFAGEGFLTLAVDLYDGKSTKDAGEAGKLMGGLDWGVAIDKVKGARAFLAAHARSSGKVGVTGFCMGGALSFASACFVEGLGAVVPFYGIPDPTKVDYAKVTAPILTHVATRDDWVKLPAVEAVQKQLAERAQPMSIEVYEADHAFANDTRPEVYDRTKAELALDRTFDFLRRNLS